LAKKDIAWPTKYDDMMPYSDNSQSYWTGYFTSRANSKEFNRRSSSHFDSANQLYCAEIFTTDKVDDLIKSKDMMMDSIGIN